MQILGAIMIFSHTAPGRVRGPCAQRKAAVTGCGPEARAPKRALLITIVVERADAPDDGFQPPIGFASIQPVINILCYNDYAVRHTTIYMYSGGEQ